MFSKQQSIDSIQPKATPRKVWRFQKREPERIFLYASPQLILFPTLTKVLGVFAAILLGPALALSFSTNAAFSKTDALSEQKLGTGKWIPDVHIEHDYHCLRLSSSLRDAVIYYEFTRDGDPRDGGMVYDGDCIDIPEKIQREQRKNIEFQAQAFHPGNREWKSRVLKQEIARKKIDTEKDKDEENEKKESKDIPPRREERFESFHEQKNGENKSTDTFLPDAPIDIRIIDGNADAHVETIRTDSETSANPEETFEEHDSQNFSLDTSRDPDNIFLRDIDKH